MTKQTKRIHVGHVAIGGGAPVSIQSMTNTDTRNVNATVDQIAALAHAGCEIVRLAIIDTEAAKSLAIIKRILRDRDIRIPLVADIHFDHTLALAALDAGVDGLRLNPGNIRTREGVVSVIREAKSRGIPIRVGVNAGSLDRRKYEKPTAENMVAQAREHIRIMEDLDFTNIKVSLKSSSVPTTIEANRRFRALFDYPLHLGVTEAGTLRSSLIKSTLGLGTLLLEGIGDTVRISITGNPVEEVVAAKMLLSYTGVRNDPIVEIISCPTCGRCVAPVEDVALALERECAGIAKHVTVAVMGCAVNGPGEARHADFGIAGTPEGGFLFFEKESRPVKVEGDVVAFMKARIEAFDDTAR